MRHWRFIFFSWLLYAFLGWCIEAAWLRWLGQPLIQGALYPLPLKPSYGLAGLMAIIARPLLLRWPLLLQWLGLSAMFGTFEVLTGLVSELVYGRALWHYSGQTLNVLGYTNGFHAGVWGLCGLIIIRVLHPALARVFPYHRVPPKW